MFKTEINGIPYYCISEEEKEHLLKVLEKVEQIGDDLWTPNNQLFLKSPLMVF